MPISHRFYAGKEEEQDYSEMEDCSSKDFDSDNSEDDPTYGDGADDDLDEAQSKLSKLWITKKPNSRNHKKPEVDDGQASDTEEISLPMLDKKDMENLEHVRKLIDSGQLEKLKLEQCKLYLRKHGLRLSGKKAILIQRIKEHIEILNGEGEKKYPPSSFVLNCKGDACMGDVVMFEQTVYEGYSIVSRSACGPPCGKRIVAGRIVKESYGAAKQQHTFTVEVLWSKGQKPLPPLHPLLIKGRNLYKLNTMRQKWEDEAERQRVLDEKHRRGSIARSNREARIQEKEAKKIIKAKRAFQKEGQNSRQQKNLKHESDYIAQRQQQTRQEPNPKFCVEPKVNPNLGMPKFQPSLHYKPNIPGYKAQSSCPSDNGPPTYQVPKPPESSLAPHPVYLKNPFNGYATSSDNFQQTQHDPGHRVCWEYKENLFPQLYIPEHRNTIIYAKGNITLLDMPQHLVGSNRGISHGGNQQRPRNTQQKLCRYYSQGRCYYANQCKFLHE